MIQYFYHDQRCCGKVVFSVVSLLSVILFTVKEIVLFIISAEEEQQHIKTKQDNMEDGKSEIEGKSADNTASAQGSRGNQTLPDSDAKNTDGKSVDADATLSKRRNLATLVEDSDEEEITSQTQKNKIQKVCFPS